MGQFFKALKNSRRGNQLLKEAPCACYTNEEELKVELVGEIEQVISFKKRLLSFYTHSQIIPLGRTVEVMKFKFFENVTANLKVFIFFDKHGDLYLTGRTQEDLNEVILRIDKYFENISLVALGNSTSQIVGKKGQNVKWISNYSGAKVQVNKGFAFVQGNEKQKKSARHLIGQIIREKATPKMKFLISYLKDEICDLGLNETDIDISVLRSVLSKCSNNEELIDQYLYKVKLGKGIIWDNVELSILGNEDEIVKMFKNFQAPFYRAAKSLCSQCNSKKSLINRLEEVYGPLSDPQKNIAKKAFENMQTNILREKINTIKRKLYKINKLKKLDPETLTQRQKKQIQEEKKLKQQKKEIAFSSNPEQKMPAFEVRVKGLSRDDPAEFLESDLQNIFRDCGDIKYFHWITPKANVKYQGPHGHLGDVFIGFETLRGKLKSLTTEKYQIIDPLQKIFEPNKYHDLPFEKTVFFIHLPIDWNPDELHEFIINDLEINVLEIHKTGWNSAYVVVEDAKNKPALLSLKKVKLKEKTISIENPRQLSPSYIEYMKKQDVKKFNEIFPFYMEILLEENPDGIKREEIPSEWEKRFDLPFPAIFLDKSISHRATFEKILRARNPETNEEIWYPCTYTAKVKPHEILVDDA